MGVEMLISSAIKFEKDGNEIIVMGKRHVNCLETAYHLGLKQPYVQIAQGFMTDKFEFLNRQQGRTHAINCGQVKEENLEYTDLYSEDLW